MDDRRKRLTLRAWRRGFREMDLILGAFADSHAAGLTELELAAFEALLDAPDQDAYDWILGRVPPPEAHDSALLARVRAFAAAGVLPS
ncbi:MAG TPA: succinate dehydrogenase assembly factor 2 [Caulobacterales bacterium]|jgi:antitoxin CptB|nr:succinate dehydrogenase assembly factor 2 [Caulobacterales bacterium]